MIKEFFLPGVEFVHNVIIIHSLLKTSLVSRPISGFSLLACNIKKLGMGLGTTHNAMNGNCHKWKLRYGLSQNNLMCIWQPHLQSQVILKLAISYSAQSHVSDQHPPIKAS